MAVKLSLQTANEVLNRILAIIMFKSDKNEKKKKLYICIDDHTLHLPTLSPFQELLIL